MTDSNCAIRGLNRVNSSLNNQHLSNSRHHQLSEHSKRIPRTSDARLRESFSDTAIDTTSLHNASSNPEKTYLYLAYGSNLAAETFLGKRGIRPLSQLNVVVPSIALTFDLSGIPYSEPCFANTRMRDAAHEPCTPPPTSEKTPDYHKTRWHKGLVGVVYEVTSADYKHIIETEGGGASYQDILVTCYALSSDPSLPVPCDPSSSSSLPTLTAHTLYSPARHPRPDPSYAQPSARYLHLITSGAEEHDLPTEYRTYLSSIRPYTATTTAQQLGRFIFLMTWGPLFALVFMGLGKIFLGKDGRYPKWYARLLAVFFATVWKSYDVFFRPLFGDGERSIEDGGREGGGQGVVGVQDESENERVSEKTPLLDVQRGQGAWCEPGTKGAEEMV